MVVAKRFLLEHVCCDLCGSPEYEVRYHAPDQWLWLSLYEYPVVRCRNCQLTYVNPRPTFEDTAHFYPSGYHENRDTEVYRKRYEVQFSFVEPWRGPRVLDIGCARGDWLHFLKQRWPEIEMHGVDAFSSEVIDREIRFHQCPLPEAELPPDYFDLITSWAVFEHLHTPDKYFETVARVLRPGGKFVFLVTNAESCYGKCAYREDVPRHLYHFSEQTLARYATKHDLRLDSVHFDDRCWDGRGFGTLQMMLARLVGVRWYHRYTKRFSLLQRAVLWGGGILDRLIFGLHWEARLRRSGIMIAIMSK